MLKSISKGSSVIFWGVFTSTILSYSAQSASALDSFGSSAKSDFNTSKLDGYSKTANALKFAVKDVVIPVVSLTLNTLVKVLALLFATPIPYLLICYIPYYNFYVLHKKSSLGLGVDLLTWGPRKILSIFGDDVSEELISCEELEEELSKIEKSFVKEKTDVIKSSLHGLKNKLNKVTGNFSGEEAFSKKLKYRLATAMFSRTKQSYEKSRKKIEDMLDALEGKPNIYKFCLECNALLKECLSRFLEKEKKIFVGDANGLRGTFIKPEIFSKKNAVAWGLLGQVEEKAGNIGKLMEEYKKYESSEKNENIKSIYNELENLRSLTGVKAKVSEIDKIVEDMDKQEEKIMNGTDNGLFTECVSEVQQHYSRCILELQNMKVKEGEQRDYLDKVQNACLKSKIEYFESKSGKIKDIEKKLSNCKKRLDLMAKNFKNFRFTKKSEGVLYYLVPLGRKIFEEDFENTDELKSLVGVLNEKNNKVRNRELLLDLLIKELNEYKDKEFSYHLRVSYAIWADNKSNEILEDILGKGENKVTTKELKDFFKKPGAFSLKKNKKNQTYLEILNKIKQQKDSIEALIDEGKQRNSNVLVGEKLVTGSYWELKDLLDVVKAEEAVSEIENFVKEKDTKEDNIWYDNTNFSACYRKIKELYFKCIEKLKGNIRDLPEDYLGEVQKSCLNEKIKYFEAKSQRIDELKKALSNYKEKLESIVKNFNGFCTLEKNRDVKSYSSLWGKNFKDEVEKSKEYKSLLSFLEHDGSGINDFTRRKVASYENDFFKSLRTRSENWKQENNNGNNGREIDEKKEEVKKKKLKIRIIKFDSKGKTNDTTQVQKNVKTNVTTQVQRKGMKVVKKHLSRAEYDNLLASQPKRNFGDLNNQSV